jgi:hypothetical protein
MTVAGLGAVFLLSVMAGIWSALLLPARKTAAASEIGQAKSAIPTLANAKTNAIAKALAPSARSQSAAVVLVSIKNPEVSDRAPIAADNPGSPEKIDQPAIDAVTNTPTLQGQGFQVALKQESSCRNGVCTGNVAFCGTAVNFVASPKLAEEEAAKQHKLVFVLHVSGNFEDPGFT